MGWRKIICAHVASTFWVNRNRNGIDFYVGHKKDFNAFYAQRQSQKASRTLDHKSPCPQANRNINPRKKPKVAALGQNGNMREWPANVLRKCVGWLSERQLTANIFPFSIHHLPSFHCMSISSCQGHSQMSWHLSWPLTSRRLLLICQSSTTDYVRVLSVCGYPRRIFRLRLLLFTFLASADPTEQSICFYWNFLLANNNNTLTHIGILSFWAGDIRFEYRHDMPHSRCHHTAYEWRMAQHLLWLTIYRSMSQLLFFCLLLPVSCCWPKAIAMSDGLSKFML